MEMESATPVIDGKSLIVEYADTTINEQFDSVTGHLNLRREYKLLSASPMVGNNGSTYSKLRLQTYNNSMAQLPVSDIDGLISLTSVLIVENRVVDLGWRLPYMRQPGDLVPLCKMLPENCVMAELGSFAGESAAQFRQSGKVAHIICVDMWAGGYASGDEASMSPMETAKAAFDHRMSDPRLLGQCTALRMSTVEAAKNIKDGSLDAIYVDASHVYDDVVADLRAWIPKVKMGGIIAGHDWSLAHFGVVKAVIDVLEKPDFVFPDSSWMKRKV
jgi:hypothetical protein